MVKDGWSQQSPDLLALILHQLPTADRARFQSVCIAWNCTPPVPPTLEIPWLMLTPSVPEPELPSAADESKSDPDGAKLEDRNRRSQSHMRFYSISDNRTYKFFGGHFAEIATNSRAIVSYTPRGWLMYMDKVCELQCVHLPTGQRIQTPSITTLSAVKDVKTDSQGHILGYKFPKFKSCGFLTWYYSSSIIIFPESLHNHQNAEYNRKQHSTPCVAGGYVIFAAHGCNRRLVYARQGDMSWKEFDEKHPLHLIDTFLLHDGSLYVSSNRGEIIFRIQFNSDLSIKCIGALRVMCEDMIFHIIRCNQLNESTGYLVGIDGHLYLVSRGTIIRDFYSKEKDDNASIDEDENGASTEKVEDGAPVEEDDDGASTDKVEDAAFLEEDEDGTSIEGDEDGASIEGDEEGASLDEDDDGQRFYPLTSKTASFKAYQFEWATKFAEVESIGDYAIFIGNNQSLAMSTQSFHHLSRDCIYFTDDLNIGLKRPRWDMGIFNMKDRSMRLFYDELVSMGLPQPTWVTPFEIGEMTRIVKYGHS